MLGPDAVRDIPGTSVTAVSHGSGNSQIAAPKTSKARHRPAAAALAFQHAITAVVHELSPSVVQIQSRQGLGSGVVFDSNGDIVTNNHVIGSGNGPLTVTARAHPYRASPGRRFPPGGPARV